MINDIALDNMTGDLYFDADGSMKLINGIYYVRQKLSIRLKWFFGEWFLNKTIGMPYYQKILIKNPNKLDIIGYTKRQILLTEGVKELERFDINFLERRTVSLDFLAITDYGKLQYNEIYTVT